MIKPFLYKNLLLVAIISFFIVACGTEQGKGSSSAVTYDGITIDASLSAANAQEIMLKAAESMAKSVDSKKANSDVTAANPFSAIAMTEGDADDMQQLLYHLTKQAARQESTTNSPIAAIIPSKQLGPEFCGGSISLPNTFAANADLNGTVSYNNLCYDTGANGQITINGSIEFTETSTTLTMRFNISVIRNGSAQDINATFSCSNGSCSFYSDYVGADGKTYRVSDVIITEVSTGNYSVSASFYHPDYGKVSVVTNTPLTFTCDTGHPGSGTLNFTSEDGGIAALTFNDCAGYNYSYTVSGGSEVSESGIW